MYLMTWRAFYISPCQWLQLHGQTTVQTRLAWLDELVDDLRQVVADGLVVLGALRGAHQPGVAGDAQALVRDAAERVPGTHGQGLTLVHFSAQQKRFLRDRGYI